MMKLTNRTAVHAVLSAALLLGAAAPAPAQGIVSIGKGSYKSPSNPEQTSHFRYYLTDRGNGAARGYAIWFFPKSTIVVRVTSFGFFNLKHPPTGLVPSLAFAGPIVAVFGTPSGPNAVVGRTAFSAFIDNGRRVADETAGFSVAPLPSQVPPIPGIGDLTTIQQLALLLPLSPPPLWASLVRGNVWIR
jgi:hypothetical protein